MTKLQMALIAILLPVGLLLAVWASAMPWIYKAEEEKLAMPLPIPNTFYYGGTKGTPTDTFMVRSVDSRWVNVACIHQKLHQFHEIDITVGLFVKNFKKIDYQNELFLKNFRKDN